MAREFINQGNPNKVKLTKNRILLILLLVAGLAVFTAFQMRGKGPVQYYTAGVESGEIKQLFRSPSNLPWA